MAHTMHTTPQEFKEVKERFQRALDEGTRVLLEMYSIKMSVSVVLKIKYVGNRWCMGEATYHSQNREHKVPYTIHYGDLIVRDKNVIRPKITFEGANPFG